jgi:lipoyl synthase
LIKEQKPSKPDWLKKPVMFNNNNIGQVRDLLLNLNLHTVCQSAMCPNIFECFSKKTATFMLLGNICTRNCAFCAVGAGNPLPPDKDEPQNIAKAVKSLDLKYIVLTSVTRDDLEDGGANQFAETVREIKKLLPDVKIESLVPDFKGSRGSLEVLLKERIDVLNHNVETVKENYHNVRPQANYRRSLELLQTSKEIMPGTLTKSGFMLGLGESREEVEELLRDLKNVDCDIVTIGQYLSPSEKNYPIQKYYSPEEFESFKSFAESLKFRYVFSGVFVRSSYQAFEAFGQ